MLHMFAKNQLILVKNISAISNKLTFFGKSINNFEDPWLPGEEKLSSIYRQSTDSITFNASFNSFASYKHFTVKYAHRRFAYK